MAELLAGKYPSQELSAIPRWLYTSPEIAEVGLSEQKAAERGISVLTRKALMSANGRTVIQQAERGFIKVIKEEETGVTIGAVLMCEHATDIGWRVHCSRCKSYDSGTDAARRPTAANF